jgi:hypothetical protein
MYCPKCKSEYVDGVDMCSDCGVSLVDTLLPEDKPSPDDLDFVTVFKTGDQSKILIAKSILNEAGIEYYVRDEKVQDLFGWGRIGAGFNMIVGPVKIQVLRSRAEEAKELLRELSEEKTDE